ncbi:hypothetical protein Pmani_011673 [Petrolisthes manimaculis]|uniref:C2H2-type domain-containing protein n=1 Tax=Petrolisthes manimaculis TaxID=1843537 RepID=A0AAE1PZ63_9EUCA|nr:hypothetical protein Pmani_011673 [Petrolisthes manimaculis]
MRIHSGEKPFKCPQCDRAFSLKGNLVQHAKLHSGRKSYQCNDCNKLFLKKSYLDQHARIHSGERPHKCNQCDKAFSLKGNLVQHLKRHTGEKPFTCYECGKSFALKSALKEHDKLHGDDKPFVCRICSKAFRKKVYLVQHTRVHTGERPFDCNECGKAFSQRSILNQHKKRHLEKSFKCADCHKLFLKNIYIPVKNEKQGRLGPFKCSDCEKGLYIKSDFDESEIPDSEQSYSSSGLDQDFSGSDTMPHERKFIEMLKPSSSSGQGQLTEYSIMNLATKDHRHLTDPYYTHMHTEPGALGRHSTQKLTDIGYALNATL